MLMKEIKIGNKFLNIPIIQGGMGIGISRSRLAGAVAGEGAAGIISTAQIGYDEDGFEKDEHGCNLKAIRKHIAKAKEIAGNKGIIGVNIMVAMKHYRDHIREAAKAGADLIICGAGLPTDLPGVLKEAGFFQMPAIAPIVSSKRAANLILRMWDRRYGRTADLIVAEGPKAGGHLGFSREQLDTVTDSDFDEEIKGIIECKSKYEEKFGHKIPLFVAGGIFNEDDVKHVLELGADGVQVASRFVATEECDASDAYKQAYLDAKESDIQIIASPVGMPGRALRNGLIKTLEKGNIPVKKCYNCIEGCNPREVPYCITKALADAVKGDVENGLIFCGSNVGRINEMSTVHDIIEELYV